MKQYTAAELNQVQRELLHYAGRAMMNAYHPYSGFMVGAALLARTGDIICASNVENAAYGSTICAERMALGRANAQGRRVLDKIAIIAKGKDFDTKEVTAPCGSCRQSLFEFSQVAGVDLEVIMANTKMDKIIVATISELLPLGFGPKDLGIDVSQYR